MAPGFGPGRLFRRCSGLFRARLRLGKIDRLRVVEIPVLLEQGIERRPRGRVVDARLAVGRGVDNSSGVARGAANAAGLDRLGRPVEIAGRGRPARSTTRRSPARRVVHRAVEFVFGAVIPPISMSPRAANCRRTPASLPRGPDRNRRRDAAAAARPGISGATNATIMRSGCRLGGGGARSWRAANSARWATPRTPGWLSVAVAAGRSAWRLGLIVPLDPPPAANIRWRQRRAVSKDQIRQRTEGPNRKDLSRTWPPARSAGDEARAPRRISTGRRRAAPAPARFRSDRHVRPARSARPARPAPPPCCSARSRADAGHCGYVRRASPRRHGRPSRRRRNRGRWSAPDWRPPPARRGRDWRSAPAAGRRSHRCCKRSGDSTSAWVSGRPSEPLPPTSP